MGSPMWMVGAQTLSLFSTAFPGIAAGSWIRGRANRSQTGTLLRDASIAGGGLTCWPWPLVKISRLGRLLQQLQNTDTHHLVLGADTVTWKRADLLLGQPGPLWSWSYKRQTSVLAKRQTSLGHLSFNVSLSFSHSVVGLSNSHFPFL